MNNDNSIPVLAIFSVMFIVGMTHVFSSYNGSKCYKNISTGSTMFMYVNIGFGSLLVLISFLMIYTYYRKPNFSKKI